MRLTDRDVCLIQWVNGFGFVSISQVADFMGVDFSTGARRVRALCEGGALKRQTLPMSTMAVVMPTRDGCSIAGDDLTPIAGIRVGTSRHDLMLADCARALERRFQMQFEPERRLRQRSYAHATRHMPDGLLHKPDATLIAIELELSQKAPRRLEAIFDSHAAQAEVSEVWYVVIDDQVERHVRRLAEGRDYIKIRRWKKVPEKASKSSEV